jgi:RecA-family ATPase
MSNQIEIENLVTEIHDEPRDDFSDEPQGWAEACGNGYQPKDNGPQAAPKPAKVEPLPFIDVGAWMGQPVPPQEWLVPNRIPHENVTLLSGDGGVGKTLIALQLCVGAARTGDWLGAVVEPGPAIFYTGEETEKELHRRLAAILTSRGLDFSDIARDFHAHCRPADDPILAHVDRNGVMQPTPTFLRLEQAVLDVRPRLVCIEAAGDVFGGDENKRPQVRGFIGMLRGLSIRGRTAVVLLQHPSMSGLASGTGTSGSTHWNNSCRSRMYLSTVKADAEAEPAPDLRKLEVMKSNYGPRGESIKLRWKNGLFVVEGGGSTLDKIANDAKVDEIFLRLAARLLEQRQQLGPNKGPTFAPAKLVQHPEANGITSAEFARAMQRLLDDDKIYIVDSGPPSKRRCSLGLGPRPADDDAPMLPLTRICLGCGKPFEPARAEAKFCSDTCRQRGHRKSASAGARAKSDDLPYTGPVVEVPDPGPDPLDEHGKPVTDASN